MDESFPGFFVSQKKRVDNQLNTVLPNPDDNRLAEAMHYSVLGGGKRIRGVLSLESYQLGDADRETLANKFSAIIELLHAYTLVHDDLPVMDDDDMRRGQPACHVKYDESTAVLCGNSLQSLAYELLIDETLARSEIDHLLKTVSESVGYNGVLLGQSRDLRLEGANSSRESILEMYEKKTGLLIGLALEVGGIAGKLSQNTCRQLNQVGRKLGVAFQIHDDLLEKESNDTSLGKNANSDRNRRKSTLAETIGAEKARQCAKEYVSEGQTLLERLPGDTDRLTELASFLVQRKY